MKTIFTVRRKYSFGSALRQKQLSLNMPVCAVANLDSVPVGDDVRKIKFDNRALCSSPKNLSFKPTGLKCSGDSCKLYPKIYIVVA